MPNNTPPLRIVLTALLLIIVLTGCQTFKSRQVNLIKGSSKETENEEIVDTESKKNMPNFEWIQKPLDEEPIMNYDDEKQKGELQMNFNDQPIPKIIETMMTGIFKLNFIMTDQVKELKKKISIRMNEDLSFKDAFYLFAKILELYNISITKETNTYIFAISGKAKYTVKGPILYGRKVPAQTVINDSDEVTILVPFYNISPNVLHPIIKKELPQESEVVPIKDPNVLMINTKFSYAKYVFSLIELLDRAQFKEKSIMMLRPKYWGITEFYEKLKELLEAEGVHLEEIEKSGSKSLVFIPIENLNYMLVISSVKDWLERILYWLKKLDIPEAAGESKKVFCYKLRNVEVDSVMKVLEEYQADDSPGMGMPGRTSRRSSAARSPALNPGSPGGNPGMGMGGGDESALQLIPIKETNSVVVVANPAEYKKYLDILKLIDVPRSQVFVEVIIGEISVDKSTQLGLEFWINKYLYKTQFGTKGGLGVFQGEEAGKIKIPAGTNFNYNGLLPGTQFDLLINALITDSKINIISSPKLTVIENEEAEISVGADIPILSGESGGFGGSSSGGTDGQNTNNNSNIGGMYVPYRQIQYQDTGIILKIKPAILDHNKVSLEIDQQVSEAQENTKSNISSPEILKRHIKTTMIVNEGEIGFLGGLIQSKKTSGRSGIPILSKIPLLGSLFKKESDVKRKTELVFFINAKVIRRSNDMREIVREIKNVISEHIYLEDINE
jgi:general secretion pathway protein D